MGEDRPSTKPELLRRQYEGRAKWEALLATIPIERIAEPGASGELSVKDVVAHLAAWERHATERLRARMRGEPPEALPEGMSWAQYEHEFNMRVRDRWRSRGWDEVQAEATNAYGDFIAAAKAMPEEMLFASEHPAWQTVAFNGYLHYLDFAKDVGAWLERQRARPDRT